jgi:hypothetical protein
MAEETPPPSIRFDFPNEHELMPRRFKDYIVSERELHTLGFLSNLGAFLLAFLGIAVGSALSIGMTLNREIITDRTTLAVYWGLFGASAFSSIVLLCVCSLMIYKSASEVRAIKENSEQEKRKREMLAQQNIAPPALAR